MFHEIRLRKGGSCYWHHVVKEGMINNHMMRFCQNTRPAFLARTTPMPLISDSLGSLDAVILTKRHLWYSHRLDT